MLIKEDKVSLVLKRHDEFAAKQENRVSLVLIDETSLVCGPEREGQSVADGTSVRCIFLTFLT